MIKSLLFIPANHPGMMQNADIFNADAIIFDLEDGVIHTEKDAAKDLLNNYFNHYHYHHKHIIIRINHDDDILYISLEKVNAILLPKATEESVLLLDKKLSAAEKKQKIQQNIGIIALIETPESVLKALSIAKHDRVTGLLLGAEDLATHLGVQRTIEGHEIEFARNMVIYAAKSYQKDAIDTPFTDVNDIDGLKRDAAYAKSLGMNAKTCIHPNQIEVVNQVFMPSKEDIAFAKKIMLAKEKAEQQGLGAFSVDGKMIDQPIILRAKKILDQIED